MVQVVSFYKPVLHLFHVRSSFEMSDFKRVQWCIAVERCGGALRLNGALRLTGALQLSGAVVRCG